MSWPRYRRGRISRPLGADSTSGKQPDCPSPDRQIRPRVAAATGSARQRAERFTPRRCRRPPEDDLQRRLTANKFARLTRVGKPLWVSGRTHDGLDTILTSAGGRENEIPDNRRRCRDHGARGLDQGRKGGVRDRRLQHWFQCQRPVGLLYSPPKPRQDGPGACRTTKAYREPPR